MKNFCLILITLAASSSFAAGPTLDITDADGCPEFMGGWPFHPWNVNIRNVGLGTGSTELDIYIQKDKITIEDSPNQRFVLHIEERLPSLVITVVFQNGTDRTVEHIDFETPSAGAKFNKILQRLRLTRAQNFWPIAIDTLRNREAPYHPTENITEALMNASFYLLSMTEIHSPWGLEDLLWMLSDALEDTKDYNTEISEACEEPPVP